MAAWTGLHLHACDMGAEVIKIETLGYSWDDVESLKEKQVI